MSLLLALLRKKLAEFDAGGVDTRLILSRDQVAEWVERAHLKGRLVYFRVRAWPERSANVTS